MKEIFLVLHLHLKKFHHFMFFKMKDATNVKLYFIENIVRFVDTLSRQIYFGIQLSRVDLNKATS